MADVQSSLHFVGFPAHHPDMAAFLGVPIHAGSRTIGSLYVTRRRGRPPFSDADELSASLLALHVAIHIKDAMASEESERVALLAERGRIAHDLHDGTIQVLYAMGLESDSVALREDLPQDVREVLREHVTRINQLIVDIREYIKMLEAETPEGPPELSRDLAYVARQIVPPGIGTILNVKAAALQEIDAREAEDILFIAREALSNAVRHGSPTRVAIDVRQTPEETTLTVQDDGVGFEPLSARVGLGTVTMRTRAARLGAELTIISIPGMGTTMRLRLPRRATEETND
jgi:signal transduction histidine kinase